MTYRIHRSAATDNTIVFTLSGDMNLEHSTQLEEILASEVAGRVTLDLKDVTLVDRDAVGFLSTAEAAGIQLVNCPDYVRGWITAERQPDQARAPEPPP